MRRENRANERRRSVKQGGAAHGSELQRAAPILAEDGGGKILAAAGRQSVQCPSSGMSRKFPAKHAIASRCCE